MRQPHSSNRQVVLLTQAGLHDRPDSPLAPGVSVITDLGAQPRQRLPH